MQVEVIRGDILRIAADALVIPTLSSGEMRDGIAARVKRIVGAEVEQDVIAHQPISVGAAYVSRIDGLPAAAVIHAPIIEEMGQRVGVENIRRTTRAGLLAAEHYEMTRLAIPGMGYGEGLVSHEEAARAIIDEVAGFRGEHPLTVLLVDQDETMYEAFCEQAEGR